MWREVGQEGLGHGDLIQRFKGKDPDSNGKDTVAFGFQKHHLALQGKPASKGCWYHEVREGGT